ncbi:hypothetical protein SAMN04488134_10551 [Amphibacillus marinus]|uniref:Uncharacterized protein n=1 Tax=Amphibacillus marinus TaxID=872970 RepID=A0A1H8MYN9_9BACI|nr:hypothetical protein [Amphibacillus marinus]SEO22373.1 hypothetical protein SAMN04488134_10551 [Amphibacillus marinus]
MKHNQADHHSDHDEVELVEEELVEHEETELASAERSYASRLLNRKTLVIIVGIAAVILVCVSLFSPSHPLHGDWRMVEINDDSWSSGFSVQINRRGRATIRYTSPEEYMPNGMMTFSLIEDEQFAEDGSTSYIIESLGELQLSMDSGESVSITGDLAHEELRQYVYFMPFNLVFREIEDNAGNYMEMIMDNEIIEFYKE